MEEIIEAVSESVTSEVESELLNTTHTNILLLKQLFSQAEKWHLNLETDMSELENRLVWKWFKIAILIFHQFFVLTSLDFNYVKPCLDLVQL